MGNHEPECRNEFNTHQSHQNRIKYIICIYVKLRLPKKKYNVRIKKESMENGGIHEKQKWGAP